MSITHITTVQTTAVTATSNANIIIDTDGRLVTLPIYDAISNTTGQYIDITILGGIFAEGQAINLTSNDGTNFGTGEHQVFIGQTGTVYSDIGNRSTIYLEGDQNQVNNHGQIFSRDTAVEFENFTVGGGSFFFNSGIIDANDTAFHVDHDDTNDGQAVAIGANTGSMTGQRNAAIDVNYGALDFTNSGTIHSHTDDGIGMFEADLILFNSGDIIGARGIDTYYGALDLVNTGTIRAHTYDEAIRVTVYNTELYHSEITNSGLIDGDIAFGDGNDTVRNSGTVVGDIILDDGDDLFDGRGGTVTGTVDGGNGNDVYIIDDSTTQIIEGIGVASGIDEVRTTTTYALGDNIEELTLLGATNASGIGNDLNNVMDGNAGSNRVGGSGGDDTLSGHAGNDSLFGGGGNDEMHGGEGDDYISAGAGGDDLYGDDGDDHILGRRGADSVNGGDGADLLEGGDGNDNLLGGRDEDTLIGGEGSDTMNGGSGTDTFLWTSAGESPDGSGRDVINGFEVGNDLIDLSAFGIDVSEVHIGGSISGGGVASLRTYETTGGDTRIYVDTDGDGVQDMRIDLLSTTGITGIDFIV